MSKNNNRSLAAMRRAAREYNDRLMDTMIMCMHRLGIMDKKTSLALDNYYCKRLDAFIHIEDSELY